MALLGLIFFCFVAHRKATTVTTVVTSNQQVNLMLELDHLHFWGGIFFFLFVLHSFNLLKSY